MDDLAAAIDAILVRHSRRGMDRLQPLVAGSAVRAARAIVGAGRGTVAIVTGFWVAGTAETDGPLGAMVLAHGLARLGFAPVIVADPPCSNLLDGCTEVALGADPEVAFEEFRRRHRPSLLIAIERCGRNAHGDYANMRGVSIAAHTAPLDRWFDLARGTLPTIAIGDGGNEVGMGLVADAIRRELGREPCVVATDHLVPATVSNWGAYGLLAALGAVTGRGDLLPAPATVAALLDELVARGAVDGVSGRPEATVDGFPATVDGEVITALAALGP